MRVSWLRAILLLAPTLVLAGWALSIPVLRSGDPVMRIRLLGYDPRDLLRGHYLLARLDIDGLMPGRPGPADCVCITDRPDDPGRPGFTPLPSCRPVDLAACPTPLADPGRELRLYQPKARALALEQWLREDGAMVDIGVRFDGRGGIALEDLRVDGRPVTD